MIWTLVSKTPLLYTANVLTIKTMGTGNCRGPCRENLHYLWKRAVRIVGFPCNCGVSLQFLQPFSIDSADFPCKDPTISSHQSFYGQNICSVLQIRTNVYVLLLQQLRQWSQKHLSILKVFKPLTWGISFQLNITVYSDHTFSTEDTGTIVLFILLRIF